MNNWYILGIEPTKDKDLIKEAYFNKLNTVHPEEDPEGFKSLRDAYEELIKGIDEVEEEKEDTSEVGLWIKEVKRIYNNFALRLNEEYWVEILNNDICFAIDSKEEALNALLNFLMDNCYLTQNIWKLIDNTFNIKEKRQELLNIYQSEFIDFIINKIDYGSLLNYRLFEIGENVDYDRWIYLYNQIRRKIFSNDIDKIEEKFTEIKALNIYHPYLEALEVRLMLCHGEIDKAREVAKVLLEKYLEEIEIIAVMSEIEWMSNNYEEAIKYYEMELNIDENFFDALSGKADCLKELGQFEEAKDIYNDLIRRNSYDDYVRQKIYEVNNSLAEKFVESLKEEENSKIRFRLCWCLYDNCRYEEAISFAKEISINEDDENYAQYCDLMGCLYIEEKEYSKGYSAYDNWEKILNIESENQEDRDMLGYIYYRKAKILTYLDKNEEAVDYYKSAIKVTEEKTYYLNSIASILNTLGRYNESLEYSEKSLELDNYQAEAYINRAKSLMGLEYDRDALDDCYRSIDIYPYFTEAYILQAKLYSKYGEHDDVLNIVKSLEKIEIEDYRIDLYKIKAYIGKREYNRAKEVCEDTLKKIISNKIEDKEFIGQINYQMAIICNDNDDLKEALRYVSRAIEIYPDYYDFYYFKAYVYQREEKYDYAIKIYEDMELIDNEPAFALINKAKVLRKKNQPLKAIEVCKEVKRIDPNHKYINGILYEIYRELKDEDNAIRYLDKQLEEEPTAYYYIEKGIIFAEKDENEEAIVNYKKAIKLEPDNKYGYNNIACIYFDNKDYKKAIEFYEKAIEYDNEKDFSDCVERAAKCYYLDENVDKGIELLKKNIKEYVDFKLYERLAWLFKKLKRYGDAIEIYRELFNDTRIELDNELKASFLKESGECYEFLNEYDRALEQYMQGVDLNPKDDSLYELIADIYVYYENGDYATKYIDKHLKNFPDDVGTIIKAGEIYNFFGKKWRAKRHFKKALDLLSNMKDKNACVNNRIGRCYIGLGDFSTAKKYLEIAINSAKDCSDCDYNKCFEAYYHIGRINEVEKNFQEALKFFDISDDIKGEGDIDTIKARRRVEKIIDQGGIG